MAVMVQQLYCITLSFSPPPLFYIDFIFSQVVIECCCVDSAIKYN